MAEKIQGKISFINHEKKYAMIEYEEKNKKKTVRAAIDEKTQALQQEKKLIRKPHHFMMGDIVSFRIKLSPRGDRMMAEGTEFLYNNALDVLLNKAKTDNRFIGYLKNADDAFFVKEIDSYLFFPVPFSPWQILPAEKDFNEQVTFSLENLDKKEKIFAVLADKKYIPEFREAVKLMKSKTAVEAVAYKISPHAVYLNVIGEKIRAKIPMREGIKAGDKISVLITHIGTQKIAVKEAG